MDADDLDLFERSIRHATEQHSGAALNGALDELGWVDALAEDRRAAVSILFELQGAGNVTSSSLDRLLADALGVEGRAARSLVLPAVGRWDPPGSLAGSQLRVDGLVRSAVADAESVVVVASTDNGHRTVDVTTSMLDLEPVEGIDPTAGLARVTGEVAVTSTTETPDDSWTSAVALGRLALAHELVGASRKMLELAREHALERVQFGVPISSFQAVRHRLAETLVAIEMADAVIDAAWLDGSPDSAAMAKATAGRQARTTARHCQQVLAGIGFTTEHDLHLYVRRTLLLDGLLGTATSLTRALGDDLIVSRQLPPLLPL